MDGFFGRGIVPRADMPGDDHACAHGETHEEGGHQIDVGSGGGDGGQGVRIDQVADNQRVYRVVHLLKEMPDEHRHREADQLAADIPFSHKQL